jgi:hypothetical protein
MGGDSDDYEDDQELDAEDFEIIDSQPEKKKSKPEANSKKRGRPTKKEKYKFTEEDKRTLAEAVKLYGTQYAAIAKEYFSKCIPSVTRTDIANLVNNTPHLRKYCQTEHKKLKEAAHSEFVSSMASKKSTDRTNSCEQIDSPVRENDDGTVTVSNSNFLAVSPFFFKKPDYYTYFYRLNLSQDLDVDYDGDSRILQFEIYTSPALLPFELDKTKLWADDPTVQVIDKEERLKSLIQIHMPEDARLDESIERNEYDTDVGALVEITIQRKKEADKSKCVDCEIYLLILSFLIEWDNGTVIIDSL